MYQCKLAFFFSNSSGTFSRIFSEAYFPAPYFTRCISFSRKDFDIFSHIINFFPSHKRKFLPTSCPHSPFPPRLVFSSKGFDVFPLGFFPNILCWYFFENIQLLSRQFFCRLMAFLCQLSSRTGFLHPQKGGVGGIGWGGWKCGWVLGAREWGAGGGVLCKWRVVAGGSGKGHWRLGG
jgi:hypothetical protein